MKNSYSSFDYWEDLIHQHKTLRGNIFMDELPKEKSIYIHTLIFSRKNRLISLWSYFPNEKLLLGYIQHVFLQEAFYKWIYGRDEVINIVPNIPVESIISKGESAGKISKEIADEMRKQVKDVAKLWGIPREKLLGEIKKFVKRFNRKWYGDHTEFLYMNVFETPTELANFIVDSTRITNSEEDFEKKINMTIDEWLDLCNTCIGNVEKSEKFRSKLVKSLSEVI